MASDPFWNPADAHQPNHCLRSSAIGVLWEVSAAGAGPLHLLGKSGFQHSGPPSISPNGEQFIVHTEQGIVAWPIKGKEGNPNVVAGNGYQPCFSPDGRWFVYRTTGSGGGLFVQPFPGPGPRRQIAPEDARTVLWRKDGKEILYHSGNALMSVAVKWNGNTPAFSPPRKLFSGLRRAAASNASSVPLAVSHDGSRIFWIENVEQPESNVIHVKTNWFK
jgi:hypothetical protein